MATRTSQTSTPAGQTLALVIDKVHSDVSFTVRHLVTKVRGRFLDFRGRIIFNEAVPERSTAEFTLNADSIDTADPDRDTHLRSEDFLFVERHPFITFCSTHIEPAGSHDEFDVSGNLTIRGVTREVTLLVDFLGKAVDLWGHQKVGFEATCVVDRKDFGLRRNAALEAGGLLLGDEISVSITLQTRVVPAD
jgi:polyisoprenoid-binding protein YceI